MPSTGPIRWKEVKPHLDELLPGWTLDQRTHCSFLRCPAIRPEPYRLPRGAHGSGVPEIRLGDLRKLLRHFDKEKEGKERIPRLR